MLEAKIIVNMMLIRLRVISHQLSYLLSGVITSNTEAIMIRISIIAI